MDKLSKILLVIVIILAICLACLIPKHLKLKKEYNDIKAVAGEVLFAQEGK